MNPSVSVIIPAFNTAAYIARSITSVLAQGLREVEVIIADDGSTDNTVEVARSFDDERVRVLVSERNEGVARARNRAIDAATGTYVALLDSDDWFAPDRLEHLVTLARDTGAEMVADDLFLVHDGEDEPWGTLIGQSNELVLEPRAISAAEYVHSSTSTGSRLQLGFSQPLVERRLLADHGIRYDTDVSVGEDFWWAMDCFAAGARFVLSPRPGYYYRGRADSLVASDRIERLTDGIAAIDRYLERHAGDLADEPELVRALLHKRELERREIDYVAFTGHLKRLRLRAAGRQAARTPHALSYAVREMPRWMRRSYRRMRGRSTGHSEMFANV